MPKNEFMKEVRNCVASRHCNLWPHEIAEIAERNDQEVINSGEECVVIPGKDKSREVVVAYTYFDLNPLRAKELFYSQRIYSTLFPNNFPHFYAAFGGSVVNRSLPSGTIRQKIEGQKGLEIRHPFQKVIEVCSQINLPLLIPLSQIGGDNVVIGEDGGEYYLDTTAHLNPTLIDKAKLSAYMKENKYSQTEIHVIEISITRLEEVYRLAAIQREEIRKNRPSSTESKQKQ